MVSTVGARPPSDGGMCGQALRDGAEGTWLMDATRRDRRIVEEGLHELAAGKGPSAERLERALEGSGEESLKLRTFVSFAADSMPVWPAGGERQSRKARAAALLSVIREQIES